MDLVSEAWRGLPSLRWRARAPGRSPSPSEVSRLDSWHHEIGFNSLYLLPVPKFLLKSATIGNNPIESRNLAMKTNAAQWCSMVLVGSHWFLMGFKPLLLKIPLNPPGLRGSRDQVSQECYQSKLRPILCTQNPQSPKGPNTQI